MNATPPSSTAHGGSSSHQPASESFPREDHGQQVTVEKFDLIVLGSGPAGSQVAVLCAEGGQRVAVVESRELGGTCALRGCNPKKVYTNAAALVDAVRKNQGTLIVGGEGPTIDWPQLHRFQQQFTDPVPDRTAEKYQRHGIEHIVGAARFLGPRTLAAGTRVLEGERIVIATGQTPTPLSFPGSEFVLSSDEFLGLHDLPARVLFIGGGYISFEFAHAVARTGREVRILDSHDRPLSAFDATLVEQLCRRSEEVGIRLERNSQPERIVPQPGGGYVVTVQRCDETGQRRDKPGQRPGETVAFPADLIVNGAGRVPHIAALDLPAGNVDSSEKGVVVDDCLRSVSNRSVFAAGDCAATGRPALTPVANREGKAIAHSLLSGQDVAPQLPVIPSIVFTTPPLAMVGMTVEAAERDRVPYELKEVDLSTKGSMRKVGETAGGARFLIDPASRRILGAHLLCPHAEEIINLFALAMAHNLTPEQITDLPLTYPTFTAEVVAALE